MDAPPVQYVRTSDGVNIAYMSIGRGKPVVFASNIFGDAHYYRSGLLGYRDLPDQLVAAGFQAILMDVRGMGSSDRSVPDVSLEAWTEDVRAVSGHLGLRRFALYGSDVGAAIAIAYAFRHPKEVSHLILLRPWLTWQQRAEAQPTIQVVHSMRPRNDQQWAATARFIATMAAGFQADSEEAARVASAIQEACSLDQYNAYTEAAERIDLTDILPALKVQTMVLHIPNMVLATYEQSRDVATRITGARFAEYNPPQTFPTLIEFLREENEVEAGSRRADEGHSGLSHRELEVLHLLAAGLSNQQIADELVISLNTVRRHVSNIFDKTGAANRAQATAYAKDHELA